MNGVVLTVVLEIMQTVFRWSDLREKRWFRQHVVLSKTQIIHTEEINKYIIKRLLQHVFEFQSNARMLPNLLGPKKEVTDCWRLYGRGEIYDEPSSL